MMNEALRRKKRSIYQMSIMCHLLSFTNLIGLHNTPAMGMLLIPAS